MHEIRWQKQEHYLFILMWFKYGTPLSKCQSREISSKSIKNVCLSWWFYKLVMDFISEQHNFTELSAKC